MQKYSLGFPLNRRQQTVCVDCGAAFERLAPRRVRCDSCRERYRIRKKDEANTRAKQRKKAARATGGCL